MKWQTIIGISAATMFCCSSGGSIGDLSGGGVIGNPSSAGFAFVDSVKCPGVMTSSNQIDLGNGTSPISQPSGQGEARVGEMQQYTYPTGSGTKRFLFSGPSTKQVTQWSPDSQIDWAWTTTGVCSVQVQVNSWLDTMVWSKSLIVHVID
jgi:hypothetical protein